MNITRVWLGLVWMLSAIHAVDVPASAGSESLKWVQSNIPKLTVDFKEEGLPEVVDYSSVGTLEFGSDVKANSAIMTIAAFDYLFQRSLAKIEGIQDHMHLIDQKPQGFKIACVDLPEGSFPVSEYLRQWSLTGQTFKVKLIAIALGVLEKFLRCFFDDANQDASVKEVQIMREYVRVLQNVFDFRYNYATDFDPSLIKVALGAEKAVLLRVEEGNDSGLLGMDVGSHYTMLLVGYSDLSRTYKVRHPFGSTVGDNGYFHISYDQLPGRVSEIWILDLKQPLKSSSGFWSWFGY